MIKLAAENRPSGFCEAYISVSMETTILKRKQTDALFSKLKFMKYSKQLIEPSRHKISVPIKHISLQFNWIFVDFVFLNIYIFISIGHE